MLHEVLVVGEVILLAMFEHEDAVGSKEVSAEDKVGQGGKLLQCIGRVSFSA